MRSSEAAALRGTVTDQGLLRSVCNGRTFEQSCGDLPNKYYLLVTQSSLHKSGVSAVTVLAYHATRHNQSLAQYLG